MSSNFPNFTGAKVTVIGDIMLDHYFHGDVSRISPEAPVPIVKVNRETLLPGGAANVAVNTASLGCQTKLIGLVGDDEKAVSLLEQLNSIGVKCNFNYSKQPTIVKTRVMGAQQQLLRMDFEECFSKDYWKETLQILISELEDTDVLVLSDYAKGTLVDCQAIIKNAKEKNIPVLVDPKGTDFSRYANADLLTPNLSEFTAVVGSINSEPELHEKAQQLINKLNIGALLITRSDKGMSLFRKDHDEFHLPAISKEITDVTGAGDTVIACVTAAIASGLDVDSSVSLSNIAASIVVSKSGTAAITAPELELEYNSYHKYDYARGILNKEQLILAIELAKKQGKKIVFTNGCFDILHAGHVAYLEEARKLGDLLIVAINDDDSVTKLKGKGRPINNLDRRLTVLQGLESVDWVTSFSGDTPETLLEELQPNILVKGGDYSVEEVVGKEIVFAYGGEVHVMSMVAGCSTSQIIEKTRK